VEALQAGAAARRRRQACIVRLAGAARARPSSPDLPADLEELLVGGALSHVARYVDAGHVEQLPDATAERRRVDIAHLGRIERAAPLLLDRVLDEGRVVVDRDG
jgi:hypothetical protein